MLQYLAEWTDLFGPLRVFESLTFRAMLGLVISFVLTVWWGPRFIARMRRLRATEDVNKPDSATLHALHQGKSGTPTMGGLLICVCMLVTVLLTCSPENAYVWIGVLLLVGFGALGLVDDYYKLRGFKNRGLTKRQKLAGQTVLAAVAAGAIWFFLEADATTRLLIPFTRWAHVQPDLGGFYYAFFVFVIVSCSNAVNLTDGLDGLASGCTIMVAITFSILAYVGGNTTLCEYFRIPHVPGTGELAIFCAVMVGAVMGFLWFNSHPAEVFMGDTGSLALGACIAYASLAIKQELVLVIAGGIFVLEGVSVVLQVIWVRWRGKRIFLCAPFHHHLEFAGWHENKVVIRLWLVAAILSALALGSLKMH